MSEQNAKPLPANPHFPSQDAEFFGLAPLFIPTEDVEMLGLAPVQFFESSAEEPAKDDINRTKPEVSP